MPKRSLQSIPLCQPRGAVNAISEESSYLLCNIVVMHNAAKDSLDLINVVASDTKLHRSARQEARRLVPLAASQPELVEVRLEDLRRRVVTGLPLSPPNRDYARCVSVDVFWRFHLATNLRDFFRQPGQYQKFLETQADPSAVAGRQLAGGVLVPAPHSWLIPEAKITGLSGLQTRSRLQIKQKPPYLVMIFPMALMKAAGVGVREPRGLDAVPGRFVRWSPGGVSGERIDKDIPVAALGDLEWRP